MNPYWWKADYGNSNWDIRHRVVATFVYDIPFFAVYEPDREERVRQLAGERHRHAADGLTVQRLDRDRHREHGLQRHLPAEPGPHADRQLRARSPGRLHRPDRLHDADLYPSRRPTTRTATPAATCSSARVAETVNFSLFKNFPIKERLRFQFRFETFGLFNHTNFGNPSATINTSSFGNITGASGARTIQLGAKLQF